MPGVACSSVICSSSSACDRRLPSMATSRCTITSSAPVASGSSRSGTAMSNDSVVTAAMRSDGPMPDSRCIHCSRCATPRWCAMTPLGRPVEPEV
ncbi:hypothetical protein FQZ97_799450 [compost metagenome]